MQLAQRIGVLRKGFTRTFWVANILELFERFAFYGSKAVLAVYLNRTVGLGTTGNDLVGVYGGLVFGLPILAGVVVDRFGFKRSLLACFSIFCFGYTLIALAGMPAGQPLVDALGKKGYVVLALVVTAIGGSLIKPCIVGTVARTTTEETKSLGYSIYYTLVNFGGVLGPILASEVRTDAASPRSPHVAPRSRPARPRDARLLPRAAGGPRGAHVREGLLGRGARPPERPLLEFPRHLLGLLDHVLAGLLLTAVLRDGHPEDRALRAARDRRCLGIIFLSVPVDRAHEEARPIRAMASGFAVASASWLVIAFSQSWQGVVVAMLFFALGESMQAPRFYEYVADLAPKEQTGTYMGFAFLPVAIGAFAAGPLSGYLIEHYLKGPKPGGMWTLLSAIGFAATVGMLLYDRFLAPRKAAA